MSRAPRSVPASPPQEGLQAGQRLLWPPQEHHHLGQCRGRSFAAAQLHRPQGEEAELPRSLDPAHQCRLPRAWPHLQPIYQRAREAGIEIDRKVLSDLAMHEPDAFKALVDQAAGLKPASLGSAGRASRGKRQSPLFEVRLVSTANWVAGSRPAMTSEREWWIHDRYRQPSNASSSARSQPRR